MFLLPAARLRGGVRSILARRNPEHKKVAVGDNLVGLNDLTFRPDAPTQPAYRLLDGRQTLGVEAFRRQHGGSRPLLDTEHDETTVGFQIVVGECADGPEHLIGNRAFVPGGLEFDPASLDASLVEEVVDVDRQQGVHGERS